MMKVQSSIALEPRKAREFQLLGFRYSRRALSIPPAALRPKSAPVRVNRAHHRPAIFTDYPQSAVHAHSEPTCAETLRL